MAAEQTQLPEKLPNHAALGALLNEAQGRGAAGSAAFVGGPGLPPVVSVPFLLLPLSLESFLRSNVKPQLERLFSASPRRHDGARLASR